jgi:hypothetical protein
MSKASEWVKRCEAARKTAPEQFRSPSDIDAKFAFKAEVDYLTGNLRIQSDMVTPKEALRFADWIIDTFKE